MAKRCKTNNRRMRKNKTRKMRGGFWPFTTTSKTEEPAPVAIPPEKPSSSLNPMNWSIFKSKTPAPVSVINEQPAPAPAPASTVPTGTGGKKRRPNKK